MDINITSKGRNLIVKINGDIDHHLVEEIKFKIDREFTKINAKNIIFDFSNLEFMDSSGLGMILGRYKAINQKGGQVALVSVNETPKKLIELSGLHKILKCYNNLALALDSLR